MSIGDNVVLDTPDDILDQTDSFIELAGDIPISVSLGSPALGYDSQNLSGDINITLDMVADLLVTAVFSGAITITSSVSGSLGGLQGANHPPNIAPISVVFDEGVPGSVNIGQEATDPDDDPLILALNTADVALPPGVTWDASTGVLSYDGRLLSVQLVDLVTTGHVLTAEDGRYYNPEVPITTGVLDDSEFDSQYSVFEGTDFQPLSSQLAGNIFISSSLSAGFNDQSFSGDIPITVTVQGNIFSYKLVQSVAERTVQVESSPRRMFITE